MKKLVLIICKYVGVVFILIVGISISLRLFPETWWSKLGNVDVILSIATMIIAAITWIKVDSINAFRKKDRNINVFDEDIVLALDTGNSQMDGQVKSFLENNEFLKDLKGKELTHKKQINSIKNGEWEVSVNEEFKRLIYIRYSEKYIKDVVQAAEDLRLLVDDVCDILRADGVRGIHFFSKGIGVYSIFLGDYFSNNFRVSVYHFESSKYIKIGELGGIG